MNVFKILEIKPTNNFITVKRAFLTKAIKIHPDKNPNAKNQDELKAQFQELNNAFELVNSPKKLNDYISNGGKQKLHNNLFNNKSTSTSEKNTGQPDAKGTELRVPTPDKVTIYLPLEVNFYFKDSFDKYSNVDSEITENDLYNFNKIANVLTKLNSKYVIQLGVTFKEALDIVNQHSTHDPYVIVKLSISLNRISDEKNTETELGSFHSNKNIPHFFLLAGTQFQPQDILSLKPMESQSYEQPRRGRCGLTSRQLMTIGKIKNIPTIEGTLDITGSGNTSTNKPLESDPKGNYFKEYMLNSISTARENYIKYHRNKNEDYNREITHSFFSKARFFNHSNCLSFNDVNNFAKKAAQLNTALDLKNYLNDFFENPKTKYICHSFANYLLDSLSIFLCYVSGWSIGPNRDKTYDKNTWRYIAENMELGEIKNIGLKP